MTDSRAHYHHLLPPAKELEAKRNGHGMNAFKNGYAGQNIADSLHSTSASSRMVLPGQDLTTHLAATPQYPAQSLTLLDFPMSHIPSDIRPMYPTYGMGRGSYTSMLDPSMTVLPSPAYGYRSPMKDSQVKNYSSYQQSAAYANVSSQSMSSNIHGKYQTPLPRPISTSDKLSKESLSSANPSKGYSHKDMAAYYQGSSSSSKHGSSTYSNLQPVDYRDKSKYEQDPYSSASHKSSLYSNGKYRNSVSTVSNSKSSINQSIMTGERSRNGSPYLPQYAPYNNYQSFQSQTYPSNYLDKQYAALSLSPFYNNSNGIPKPVYSSDMLATTTNHSYYSQPLHKQTPYPYPSNHLPSSQSVPSMHDKYLMDASKMMTPSVSDSPTTKQRPLKQKFIDKSEMKEKLPSRPMFVESKQRPYSSTPKDLDKMPDMKKVNEKPLLTHKPTFTKPSEYPLPNVTTTRSSVIQQNVTTISSIHPITAAGCISTVVCTSVTTTANHDFNKSETRSITSVVQSNVTPTTTESVIEKPVEAQKAQPVLSTSASEKPTTPTTNVPISTTKAAAPSKRRSSLRDETDFLYDVWMSSSEGEAENDDSSDEDYRCPEGNNARKNLRSSDRRGGSKRPQRRSSRRAIEIINSSSDAFLPFTIPDIDKDDAEKAVSACQSPQKSEKDNSKQHDVPVQAETTKAPDVSNKLSNDIPVELSTPAVDASAVKKKRGRPGRPKTSPEDGVERVKRKYVRKKPLVPRNKATAEKRSPSNGGETKVKRRRLSKSEKKTKQDKDENIASKDGISEPMDPLSSLGMHVDSLLASAESITQQVNSVMKKNDGNLESSHIVPENPHQESDDSMRFQNRTEKNMKNLKSLKEAKHKIEEQKSEKTHKPRGRPRVRPGDGLKRYGSRKKKRPRNIANIVASPISMQELEISPQDSKKFVPEDSTPAMTKEKPTKRNLSYELPPTPEEFSCSDEAMSPVAEPIPELTFAKLNVKKLTCNSAIGETVLHKAAKLGLIEHLMYYLDHGHYDVNVAENAGYTPLHKAAAYNQREAALFLLSRGADVTKCSIDGTLPLHDAVINDHLEMARILLAAGADPLVSKFSGTNILSMFYSDSMKQYINAHLKDINSSKVDPQQTEDKWRMSCSAILDDKSEHVYNCLQYPPKPDNHHIEFEFYEDEPIHTFYMQLKDDEERAEYCLVDDLIAFSGNRDFEYDNNLNSKFVTFKRFKQQVNDSQIHKKTVNCQEICDKYKIGSVPCPLKVVKFDHKIKKLLKIETLNVSACRDTKSRSKQQEHNHGAKHDVSEKTKPCEKQPADGDEAPEISVPKSCNSCTDNYLKDDKLNTNFPVSNPFQETATTSVNSNIITPSKDGGIDPKEVEKHTLS